MRWRTIMALAIWGLGLSIIGGYILSEVPQLDHILVRSAWAGGPDPSKSAHKAMPPSRRDAIVYGQIKHYCARTGVELNMKPADMVIYIYHFKVSQSEFEDLESGQVVKLRSKLSPPEGWPNRTLEVHIAQYAGGSRPYWLVEFEVHSINK